MWSLFVTKVPFDKPATTYAEQISQLIDRGMIVADQELAKKWLVTVGYYRLGAYWLTFEKPPTNGQTRSKLFVTGTKFEDVVALYTFDRRLRLLITEAIERTEIALRTSWTYHMVNAHGAHAYLDETQFDFGLEFSQQLSRLAQQVRRSSETFVKHYKKTYYPPSMPPMWVVTELMTFGELSIWVENTLDNRIKGAITRDIGLGRLKIMTGTIQALSYVRNICAHHGRLWNRGLVKKLPKINNLAPSLLFIPARPNEVENSIYNVLTILAYLLRIQSPETSFAERVTTLLDTQPDFVLRGMGVPVDWKTRPTWAT